MSRNKKAVVSLILIIFFLSLIIGEDAYNAHYAHIAWIVAGVAGLLLLLCVAVFKPVVLDILFMAVWSLAVFAIGIAVCGGVIFLLIKFIKWCWYS
jgi:hypothetical protein